MTLPDPSASQPPLPPRSRRRRRGQLILPADAEGRAALLQSLAHRAYPSYELFIFALLCGAILGLGYVLDSQAILIFGILVAPLLTPWVGLLLASITGSGRFFGETLAAILISLGLVLVMGILGGFAARPFMPRTFNEAFLHSQLWWPDLVVLAIGAVILALSFVRSEEKPFLPSVLLAYELFLPLSAGGFGLGSGLPGLWPNGALVFLVHFAWASLFGLITLIIMRFMPKDIQGFALTGGTALVMLALLIGLMGPGGGIPPTLFRSVAGAVNTPSVPTSTEELVPLSVASIPPQPSATPVVETITPTGIVSPSAVPLTLEITLPPSDTPTITLTIQPTPLYARILSDQGGGVNVRESPYGKYMVTLDNNTIVELLPDTQDVNGVTWAHIIATKDGTSYDGWILQSVLVVETPLPNWQPSETPSITSTP